MPERRKRRKREVENADYARFVERAIDGLGRRCAAGDLEALGMLHRLQEVVHGNIIDGIAGLRHGEPPESWSRIAEQLGGISKQAAAERYGKVGGRRRPGGQPGPWRLQ